MIVYITEKYLSILNEKKTASQYRKDKFKKTYDFKPDKNDKSGNTGTIKMNGRRVNVDFNTKTGIWSDVTTEKPKLYISNNYFKVKGSKARKSLIDHEDGHNRLHNINSKNTYVKRKNRHSEVYKGAVNAISKNITGSDLNNDEDVRLLKDVDGMSNISNDEYRNMLYRNTGHPDINIDKYEKKTSPNKDRTKSYEAAKKYESSKQHHDAIEYEADRYSANRNGEANLKKGLGKYYRQELRDEKRKAKSKSYSELLQNAKKEGKSNNQIKKMGRKGLEKLYVKDHSMAAAEDMKVRSKALKDEDLRKSKVYK